MELTLLYIPVPDAETGKRLAREAIEGKVAACANLLPAGESFYLWQGALCTDAERVLLLKTLPEHADALSALMESAHPYTCPCVLRIPGVQANAAYFAWVQECLM